MKETIIKLCIDILVYLSCKLDLAIMINWNVDMNVIKKDDYNLFGTSHEDSLIYTSCKWARIVNVDLTGLQDTPDTKKGNQMVRDPFKHTCSHCHYIKSKTNDKWNDEYFCSDQKINGPEKFRIILPSISYCEYFRVKELNND